MSLLHIMLLLVGSATYSQAACSGSLKGYFKPAAATSTSCYLLHDVANYTWVEARQYCVSIFGGDLASLQTSVEQTGVQALVPGRKGPSWIGLNDRLIEGNYSWTQSPTALTYNYWRPGEPNNVLDEDCVAMGVNGQWSDVSCSQSYGFICERPLSASDPPPITVANGTLNQTTDCGGWYEFQGYCYGYTGSWRNYFQARNDCFTQGATLLDINTAAEWAFIKYFMKAKRTYNIRIGLNDLLDENNFVWDDGTVQGHPLKGQTYWGKGQPNDGYHHEDCVEVQRNTYTWNDNNCNYYRPYICKRQAIKGATASTVWPPVSVQRTTCPSTATTVHHPNGALYCYSLFGRTTSLRQTWNGARAACKGLGPGSELLSIHDHIEMNATLVAIKAARYSTNRFWIGLNDKSHEGGYVWSDGTPSDYIHWDRNQPDNYRGREDCVEVWNVNNGNWNDNYCNNRYAYICKTVLNPPPTQTAPPVTTGKYCKQGWVAYGNYCYLVKATKTDAKKYTDAVTACKAYTGGNLASIHSAAELGFIMAQFGNQNASGRVYIGITDLTREGEFRWNDGSLVTYTNWHTNEPNNYHGHEDCAELDYTYGWWNDISCSALRGYVCKMVKNSPTKPTGGTSACNTGFIGYNKNCFKVSTTKATFKLAQAACQTMTNTNGLKGNLVTISSRYTQFLVSSVVQAQAPSQGRQSYWIGLNDIQTEGTYSWISSAPVTYSNWDPNEPNDFHHTEDCTTWRSWTGRWNDLNCANSQPYICEVPDNTVTALAPYPTPNPGNVGGSCAPGWHKFRGFCYGFFGSLTTDTMTNYPSLIKPLVWTDALATCNQMGSTLVTVHDNDTQHFLTSHIHNGDEKSWYSFWTGLNDRGTEGGYMWSDGSPLGYTNWATHEPNDMRGAEDCGEIVIFPTWKGYTDKWNDESCKSTRPYVCEVVAGSAIIQPTLPPPPAPPAGAIRIPNCPTGWIMTDSSCYKLGSPTMNVSVSAAQGNCRTMTAIALQAQPSLFGAFSIKGDLASLHSAMDLVAIVQAIKAVTTNTPIYYWIGLNDRQREGHYVWTDGTPVDYLAWAENQPDNYRGGEDCTEIKQSYTYLFNDASCSNEHTYVCGFSRYRNQTQLATTMNPTYSKLFCKPGWLKWKGKCYKGYISPRMTWSDAQFNCSLGGGSLLVVGSAAEQKFVTSMVTKGSEYYWVGLNDKDREGVYRWVDGEHNQYTRWGPGQPNNYNNEDCVAIHSSDSMWYDRDCGEPHAFICEVPLLSVNYTTMPMTMTSKPASMKTTAGPKVTTAGPKMTTAPHTGTHATAQSGSQGTKAVTGNGVTGKQNPAAGGLGAGAAAGIAIGGVLVVVAIVVAVIFIRKRSGRQSGSMSFRSLRQSKRVNDDDDEDDDELLAE